MTQRFIETDYRGATLRLECAGDAGAILRINGLVREERSRDPDQQHAVIRLTSTVQTDYEWHEFIEGIVDYNDDRITATLIANSAEIARESWET